ncbi:ferredoxin [Nocardia goodfellowii]
MPDGWKIYVDRTRCLGCGVCIAYAPDSFVQDSSGQVSARAPLADPLDRIQIAVDSCPTGALHLTPDDVLVSEQEG